MKEARAGLADFKHYKAMMSNLALHGVIEFVPETQDHRFRLAPSFQEAIMATFGQALTDSKWKANPAPFRDLLIESTAVNLRAAYAETLLKKEEFAVHYGRDLREAREHLRFGASCLVASLTTLEEAYNGIADAMPKFIEICEVSRD